MNLHRRVNRFLAESISSSIARRSRSWGRSSRSSRCGTSQRRTRIAVPIVPSSPSLGGMSSAKRTTRPESRSTPVGYCSTRCLRRVPRLMEDPAARQGKGRDPAPGECRRVWRRARRSKFGAGQRANMAMASGLLLRVFPAALPGKWGSTGTAERAHGGRARRLSPDGTDCLDRLGFGTGRTARSAGGGRSGGGVPWGRRGGWRLQCGRDRSRAVRRVGRYREIRGWHGGVGSRGVPGADSTRRAPPPCRAEWRGPLGFAPSRSAAAAGGLSPPSDSRRAEARGRGEAA